MQGKSLRSSLTHSRQRAVTTGMTRLGRGACSADRAAYQAESVRASATGGAGGALAFDIPADQRAQGEASAAPLLRLFEARKRPPAGMTKPLWARAGPPLSLMRGTHETHAALARGCDGPTGGASEPALCASAMRQPLESWCWPRPTG